MHTRKVICYSGINSRKNGIHTRKQFLNVVHTPIKPHSHYKNMSKALYNSLKKEEKVFREKSLEDKMKEVGATWEERNTCIKKIQETRKKRKAYFHALENPNSKEFKNIVNVFNDHMHKLAYNTYKSAQGKK